MEVRVDAAMHAVEEGRYQGTVGLRCHKEGNLLISSFWYEIDNRCCEAEITMNPARPLDESHLDFLVMEVCHFDALIGKIETSIMNLYADIPIMMDCPLMMYFHAREVAIRRFSGEHAHMSHDIVEYFRR